MPKIKHLEVKIQYAGTDYIVNDLGPEKSPRFELYNTKEKKIVKKSDNPWEFDDYMEKVWKKNGE